MSFYLGELLGTSPSFRRRTSAVRPRRTSARNPDTRFSPANSTLPIRHPSESWDPVPLALCRWIIRFAHPFGAILRMFSALRATFSFRWDDELLAISARHATIFPGQQWAKAGIHLYPRWIHVDSMKLYATVSIDSGLRRNGGEVRLRVVQTPDDMLRRVSSITQPRHASLGFPVTAEIGFCGAGLRMPSPKASKPCTSGESARQVSSSFSALYKPRTPGGSF